MTGCNPERDEYGRAKQGEPAPEKPTKSHIVNMNDPLAGAYIVRDISSAVEAGSWRWTGAKPELRIYLDEVHGLKFTADFTLPQNGFAHTGPVTISFFVNGKLLEKMRCDSAGARHFEKPVPEGWIEPRWVADVVMAPDKTWTGDQGVTYGFVLTRAGFAAM